MLKHKEFIRAQIDEAILQEMLSPTVLPIASPPSQDQDPIESRISYQDQDPLESRSSSSYQDMDTMDPMDPNASRSSSSASRPCSLSRPPSAQSLPEPPPDLPDLDVSPPKRSRSSTPTQGDLNLYQRRLLDSEQTSISSVEDLMLRRKMFGSSSSSDLHGGTKHLLASPTETPGFLNGVQFVGEQHSAFYNGLPLIQVPPFIQRSNPPFIQVPPLIQRLSPPFIQVSPFIRPSPSSLAMEDHEETSPPPKRNRKSKTNHPTHHHHSGMDQAKSADGGLEKDEQHSDTARICEDAETTDPAAEEEIAHVCDWCFSLRPVLVAYKNIGEERKYNFCSQKCFDSFRRVVYKKTKVCGWCGEGGSENESYQVGEEFIHFCSEVHHKMELLRRDGLLQVVPPPLDGDVGMNSSFRLKTDDNLPSLLKAHIAPYRDGRQVGASGRSLVSQPTRRLEIPENQEQFNAFVKQLQIYNQQVKEKCDRARNEMEMISPTNINNAHFTTQEENKSSVSNARNQLGMERLETATQRNFVKVKPDHMLKESAEAKQRHKSTKTTRSINDVKKKEVTPRRKQSLGGPASQPNTSTPAVHKRSLPHGSLHQGPTFSTPGIPAHHMLPGGLPPGGLPMHGLQNIPPHFLMSLGLGLPPPQPPPENVNKSNIYTPPLSQTIVTHTIPFFVPLPIPIPYPVPIKCERAACLQEEREKKRAEKEEQEERENEEKMQEHMEMKDMTEEEEIAKIEHEESKERETANKDKELKEYKRNGETDMGTSDIEEKELIIDEENNDSPKKASLCVKEPAIPEEQMAIKLKIYNRKTIINSIPNQNEADSSTKDIMNKDNIARIRRRAKLFDRSTEKV